MSELPDQIENETPSVLPTTNLPTAGTMLRSAREVVGLHIAALAVSLKVPVKKLEALESDRCDLLPDVVFARALAASVCRTLKIDPAPVLDKLPQTVVASLKQDEDSINTPFRVPGEGRSFAIAQHLSKPVVMVVIALLFGVLLLVMVPSLGQKSHEVPSPPMVSNETLTPMPVQLPEPVVGAVSSPPASMSNNIDWTVARTPALSCSGSFGAFLRYSPRCMD